jgi:two-component system, OmpR family, response regulator VanR
MKWILVADDDPVVREVWAEALSQAGYHTVQARDGREALRLMPKILPDLMILDLRMPGLSGNEVLQQLRERSDLSRIPVLVSSGFPDEAHESGRGLNIVGRLQKPQALTAMVEAVRAALVRRPA